MSGNNLTDLVKPVDYIPFSNKEIAKTLEKKIIQDYAEIIEVIKDTIKNEGYLRTNKDCCVGYNSGEYFLFQSNSNETNPNVAPSMIKIDKSLDCVWPVVGQLYSLSKKYESSHFVASNRNNNCTIFSKDGDKWITEDWKNMTAYPVGVFNIQNCTSEESLLYFLINHGICLVDDANNGLGFFSYISEIVDIVKINDGRIVVDEKAIGSVNITDELKNELYEIILKGKNLPSNPTSKDVIEYLKKSDNIKIGLEEYEPSKFAAFDQWFWEFWTDSDSRPVFFKPIITDETAGEVFARNPRYDKKAKEDSLIAIDFGTSSTVVVEADLKNDIKRQICVGGVNAYENPTLMYINNLGDFLASYLNKNTRPDTQWKDLQVSHRVREYMKDVASENIKAIVSHIKQWAADRDKPLFIKPANANEKPTTIDPLDKLIHTKETDSFNPIEIYAYFLGLFLNNRQEHHGIYTKYYLSYPAKYSDDVIDNIVESFRRGIRKSIPEEISDNEIIVEKVVTEPEAYATVALQEYGFQPETLDDKVKFSVFDFGGGTSDFAYGYWSGPSSEDKDRRIETVGIGGDPLLGGENLLDGLAFEVFSDSRNLNELSEKKFYFNYGLKGQDKDASVEVRNCIKSDYFATNNLTSLIENNQPNDDQKVYNLRDLWQKQGEYFINYFEPTDIVLSAQLVINEIDALLEVVEDESLRNELEEYKKEAQETSSDSKSADLINHRLKMHIEAFKKRNPAEANKLISSSDVLKAKVTLWYQRDKVGHEPIDVYISKAQAFDFFTRKIRKGIDTFFVEMRDAFGDDFTGDINIFLAGNSSKSPIFLKLMREKIDQVKQEQNENGNQIEFYLFERFDSENYSKLLREAGEKIHGWSENKIERLLERKAKRPETDKPTGKTGVAFGIIEYLTGNIEKVPLTKKYFKYYLGYGKGSSNDMVFIPFESLKATNGKPSYPATGENYGWVEVFKVTPSEEPVYKTLFYTEDHKCLDGDQYTDEINAGSKRIKFDRILPGEKIFIKAHNEDQILCITAKNADEANEKILDDDFDLESITIRLN